MDTRYYQINEDAARRAKEAMSFDGYTPGSATAEYRRMVDRAVEIARQQKGRVDPMYHDRIDNLLDTYARKLAENMNKGFEIDARVPSIMVAGGGNFPVRKKEKQNAARDRNVEEWRAIQGLLDKIRGTGMGGISADDPQALEKLRAKLAELERTQKMMKDVNAALRMKDTQTGDAKLAELGFSPDGIKRLRTPDFAGRIGYPDYALTNNNANIRRTRIRIEELEKRETEPAPEGWDFDGGTVVVNTELNRLQILFDGKPDDDLRAELKRAGFRWAPSQGAWQRQLTKNAIWTAEHIQALQPRY